MGNESNNFLNQNKKSFGRTIIISGVLTILIYISNFILIDIENFPYWKVSLFVIPLSFLGRYLLNKYWVFT